MIKSLVNIPNKQLAYILVRISFGVSFFTHGAVRFPKLQEFATGMASQFNETILAGFPSLSFSYIIPFAEAATGLLILLGGKMARYGLALGALTIGGIMFGTCILEKWELLSSQLIHLTLIYLLLINPYTAEPEEK